jgi:hypothetical protein
MSLGFSSALGIFLWSMNQVLRNYLTKFGIVYFYDISIFIRNMIEHSVLHTYL